MPVELLPDAVEVPAAVTDLAQARPYFEMHDDSATVYLARPVQAHGEDHEKLELKRPKAEHFRKARSLSKGDDSEIEPRLLSASAGIPFGSVDDLDLRDYMKCLEALNILGGF